jgi:hypothetical protein
VIENIGHADLFPSLMIHRDPAGAPIANGIRV